MDRLVHFKDPVNDCEPTTWIFMHFHRPFLLHFSKFLCRVNTERGDSRKWSHRTSTTANYGKPQDTGSTTAKTCSPLRWRRRSLLSSPWTALDTGTKSFCIHCNRSFEVLLIVTGIDRIPECKQFSKDNFSLFKHVPYLPVWCLTTGHALGGNCLCVWLILGSCTVMSCLELLLAWPESDVSNKMTHTSSALWTRQVTLE